MIGKYVSKNDTPKHKVKLFCQVWRYAYLYPKEKMLFGADKK